MDRLVTRPRHVLAIIPARGGSKSIPRKNIRMLAGHPLIAYSIAAAQKSITVSRVVVTSDDPEIAEIAREYGAEVPFVRPAHLAQDDTLDLPVFQHALTWLSENEGYRPSIVVHLRPTSPLRRIEHVDSAVQLLLGHPEADSVRAVASPLQNPFKMWRIGDDGFMLPLMETEYREPYNMPRQKLPTVYWQTGYVDATRWSTVMEKNSMTASRILPLVLEQGDWIDIDTEASLEQAEYLIGSGRMKAAIGPRSERSPGTKSGSTIPLPHRVRLLVLDFDGVMTDNRVWVTEEGKEAVAVSRSDGMGIATIRRAGIEVLVLSSEANPVVAARCHKLGIDSLQGISDKVPTLLRWLSEREIDPQDVVYVGNDVNDLGCMDIVGLGVAVQDAYPRVREKAGWTLHNRGGLGAVREICDLIMASLNSSEDG